ncbi:MAG: DUF2190 family protein [Chromatiaceae bacterium]|nr:DUF2190 family protein [Chromatiaceae bacterium]
MSWRNPLLDKTFTAAGTISPYRLVKFGGSDTTLLQAAAASDALIGVAGQIGAASGEVLDVTLVGIGEVEAGGSITRGNSVTSDANGKAVAASDGNVIIGKALMSAASGDIVPILLHAAGDSDALPLYFADVTVSTSELLALNTTPKQLVAAPGAGNILMLDSAQLWLDYATTAYDGIAAGEDLSIKYTNGSGAEVAQIEATGFLDGTADETRYVKAASAAAVQPVANAALVLHMLVGNIATGNSPLKVRTFYRVLPETWS